MFDQFNTLNEKFKQLVWLNQTDASKTWSVKAVRAVRIIFAVGNDLIHGLLTLRAMSLVYTTLLSLAPLLAVSFSVLKAFGVHNQIEPLLLNLLAPLGQQGLDISSNIIGFVENMKVGVLGTLGMAMLFYTVVALMQKIESAFNYIWHISKPRSFSQRFSDYLSVLMIGPVLVIAAIGVTGTMLNMEAVQWLGAFEPFGTLIEIITRLLPYLLIIGAFTFIYVFIPNTKVNFKAAFIGAIISGVLWETLGWGFASFVISSTKYMAIYSAFASLIFFLIWLYLGWLVLLIGSSIAFYIQNPDYLNLNTKNIQLSYKMKEHVALLIMSHMADQFYNFNNACTAKEFASYLNMPVRIVETVLNTLEQQVVIKQSNDKTPVYLPAKPLEEMPIQQILDAIQQPTDDATSNTWVLPNNPIIDQIFNNLENSTQQALAGKTVRQLAPSKIRIT